jgi:UDP-N-acetyl-2-amino-2-deoxyglucuronate dehydrogenase
MAKQWRSAVVGVGVIGTTHCRLIKQMDRLNLVATCDKDPDKARKDLAKHNLQETKIYSDLKEMLAKEQIDVVHVCTPSGDHMSPAITAMEAGKNVICEKPMEIQLDRIDKMIETASKNKVRLAGVFQNRWNTANAILKKAADEQRFGKLSFAGIYTPWWRTDQYYRDGGWRGTWKWDGGGAIMNQSVHGVDLLQWIAGPVKTVSAYGASRVHPEIEVEDTLACSLQFENGAFGVIMGSTGMYPGIEVRMEIGGADGTAVSEGGLKHFKFRNPKPEDEEIIKKFAPGAAKNAPSGMNIEVGLEMHYQNVTAILDAWERGEDAPTCGPEARKAVAIILAMYESAKKGGVPVAVK